MYDRISDAPSLDEQNGNSFPYPAGCLDHENYEAWLGVLRESPEDPELERAYVEEMQRRDLAAQSDQPILPIRKVRSTCKGFFDLLDAAGRLIESVHGATEANRRVRKLNAAS